MKISNVAITKTGWRVTRVVLVAVAVGVGAETFQSDGSTTTIEQSGGSGASRSQVIRDQDGQTLITRDGNSTDITVQRRSGAPSADDGSEDPAFSTREAFKQRMLERRRWPAP